jgi:alkanesulfonate monooxygenase SsuD/methylene tetrahydromethanopterin reductase-like flavin-dependent oxidoreductase (luciferase family)
LRRIEKAIDIYYPAHSARMGDLGRERGMAAQSRETFTAFCDPRGGYFVGGPTEVAEKILAAHEALRFDRIMLQFGVGVIDHKTMLEAIEILGTRVIPEVRQGLSKSS